MVRDVGLGSRASLIERRYKSAPRPQKGLGALRFGHHELHEPIFLK